MAEKTPEKGDEEEESVQASLSSWWGSFYDTAKQKLSETNEFLVRDMREFSQTVKNDTSQLVANTAASMKDQLNIQVNMDEASNATKVVTNSITGFLGKVVQHVTPIPPEDEEDEDSSMLLGTSSGVKVMSPSEARLFNLQTSPATYCNEPDNAVEFELWLESFDLDAKKEELSLLMLDSKEVRSLYTKLVPEAVSHVDFWRRYFYKKSELQKAEDRRAMLVERAQKDTELVWDDEDDYDVVDHPDASANKFSPSSPDVLPTAGEGEGAPHEGDVASITKEQNSTTSEEAKPETSYESDEEDTRTEAVASPAEPPALKQEEDATTSPDGRSSSPIADATSHVTEPVTSVASTVPPSTTARQTSDQNAGKSPPSPQTTPPSTKPSETSTVKVADSSNGDSSDSWEKEFDLDMTEDEINEALKEEELDNVDEDEIEGWEEWE